jgi:two-component system, OmpR family, response regulator
MSGTVLPIEDEESIATVVRAYLERDGYKVAWARSGADGLAELSRHAVRLVVLDIGLPDINGFEVCRQIRSRSTVPILMLTARDDEIDRVTGLEVGADDYVSKPFSPRELVARIKAILRRTDGEGSQERLVLGDIELNGPAREVKVAGHSVDLRAKEFDLLAFLMENRGIVVSRDTLLDRVWGMEYAGGSRTVDVHVAQLRSKLGRPNLIRTIRGAGYKAVNP